MAFQVFTIFMCLTTMVSYKKVYGQCNGTPLNVPVGYSSVLVASPGYPSPGYAANLTCAWIGSSSDSAQILFRVEDLSLRCPGDAINVYDGTDNTGPQLLTNECTATSFPKGLPYITAESGNVYTTSTSDDVTDAGENGFLLYMIAVSDFSGPACNGTELNLTATSTLQYVSSPNFPNNYPRNAFCSWRVTTQDDSAKVIFKIEFLQMENAVSNICKFDSLRILDNGTVVKDWCSRLMQSLWFPELNYTSIGNTVSVEFSTDESFVSKGFLLSYIQTEVQTTPAPETTTEDVTTTDVELTTTEKPYMPKKRRCKHRKD